MSQNTCSLNISELMLKVSLLDKNKDPYDDDDEDDHEETSAAEVCKDKANISATPLSKSISLDDLRTNILHRDLNRKQLSWLVYNKRIKGLILSLIDNEYAIEQLRSVYNHFINIAQTFDHGTGNSFQ